jgi:outer membrane protein assembly factor BamB
VNEGTNNIGVSDAPAVANGLVYLGTDAGMGSELALDVVTGSTLWTYPILARSPAVSNARVFIASRPLTGRSVLYAFGL